MNSEYEGSKKHHGSDDKTAEFETRRSHGATSGNDKATCGRNQDFYNKDMTGGQESRIWVEIDAGLEKWYSVNKKRPTPIAKGWKVVRVFVSSTFTDFFAEREILVKRVFPQLNEWCKSRKVQIIECDLRWGIPTDTTAESTIEICMNEIERCHEETGGQAFFLNLLGERYGWIPDLQQLSRDVIERYDLIEGMSITHAEILHGAIRSSSQNAAIFIRDPRFISQLPEDIKASFLEPTETGKQRLRELKAQLKARFPNQVFEYDCNYDCTNIDSGETKVKLCGLETFAENVIDFFKTAIENFFPQGNEDLTNDELNFLYQDIFIERKGALLIGRDSEVKKVVDFVCNEQDESNYLLITGTAGIGKSSLLANVVQYMKSEKINCLYNFASATPGSTVSGAVAEMFTRALMSRVGETVEGFDSMAYETKVKKFNEIVHRIITEQVQMVFIFDAVNQFSDSESHSFKWLPTKLRGNIKCIIGCTNDSQHLASLKRHLGSTRYEEIELRGFDSRASVEYVVSLLALYNKRLAEDQLECLISKNEACNPLWLALACEELRIFGVFEQLSHKIATLPGSLDELIAQIIARLISEDETGVMKDIICLLVCSTSGLTETELLWSSGTGEEPLPLMTWKTCRMLLQPYLLMVGKRRAEENLAFCHNSFNIAVRETQLSNALEKQSYHSKLANSFSIHCVDDSRVAEELPIQRKLAKEYELLVEFFRRDKRSLRVSFIQKSYYIRDFRCKSFIAGSNDRFCAPVYICNMCSLGMKAFSPMPGLNKDHCPLCGGNVPFKSDKALAFVCMKHKDFTSPNTAKCWICKTIIFLQQKARMNFNQLYLCNQCCSQGQKCIKLSY